eukprot:1187813-Prorocentrum_minimum.AAC.3
MEERLGEASSSSAKEEDRRVRASTALGFCGRCGENGREFERVGGAARNSAQGLVMVIYADMQPNLEGAVLGSQIGDFTEQIEAMQLPIESRRHNHRLQTDVAMHLVEGSQQKPRAQICILMYLLQKATEKSCRHLSLAEKCRVN